MYSTTVPCRITNGFNIVFNTWSEVEEVLDAFNMFMRSLARPEPGLEEYGDVAIFSIARGGVVISMNWSMEGGKYVLERFGIEFSDEYCDSGHCRIVYPVNRVYDPRERGLINRGLARLASAIEDSGDTTKYVIGSIVITLERVGNTLKTITLEVDCPN